MISVDIDEEHRIASVTVPERMLSLAIGREGQNARLAARLTGWRIDIRSDVSVAEAKAAAAEAAKAPATAANDGAGATDGAPAAGTAPVAVGPGTASADADHRRGGTRAPSRPRSRARRRRRPRRRQRPPMRPLATRAGTTLAKKPRAKKAAEPGPVRRRRRCARGRDGRDATKVAKKAATGEDATTTKATASQGGDEDDVQEARDNEEGREGRRRGGLVVGARQANEAPRRVPTRSCVACRTKRAKRELVRVVRAPDGRVTIDETGRLAGRGAYLCREAGCWTTALERGALGRALETPLPAELREIAARPGGDDDDD